jgi:hypothetical protein
MFDKEKLQSDAIRLSSIYASSEPFPNIVVDNFLPDNIASTIVNCFPNPNDMDLTTYQVEEK